ncbi:MAG: LacI family DNA-binding transcriptional regulator [Jiangellaceae bacterium]
MTSSIRDVAAMAGVAVGTVSNVLNRPDVVAPDTRQRVQEAIQTLGFLRNESARQLRAGRSRTVGVIVLDIGNPFFTDVARGVEDVLRKAGLVPILCSSDNSPEEEAAYLDILEEQRVQGVLITPAHGGDDARLSRLRGGGTPVILVDRRTTLADMCAVTVDDVLGGDLAATHLFEQGHDRIAYLSGPLSLQQCQDRLAGARRAARRARRNPDDVVATQATSMTFAHGRDVAVQLLDSPNRPTAVFCANDLLALGVLQSATRLGIAVPGELAIVGYDDIEFAAATAVPLTSVRQPRHLLGQTAARLLIEEADPASAHQHRQVLYNPELVVRESTARASQT